MLIARYAASKPQLSAGCRTTRVRLHFLPPSVLRVLRLIGRGLRPTCKRQRADPALPGWRMQDAGSFDHV